MATAAPFTDRKPSFNPRPGLTHFQPDPTSPHTPHRQISSTFSSPSVSFRAEEESIIIELGARHLSAGFAGEEHPRCRLSFGIEEARRAGDYRRYMPGYDERPRKKQRLSTWGDDHELWRMDIRDFDLALMQDKIERAMREAYTKYLLLDAKARKLCLIVPSVLPHRLLEKVLHTFFEDFQVPTITLVSPALTAVVAAGLRSGLVVDVGWGETIVTAVYEYRQVRQDRSVRGMKMVNKEMGKMLERCEREKPGHSGDQNAANEEEVSIEVDQAEEVTARMAWCNPRIPMSRTTPPPVSAPTNDAQPAPNERQANPAATEPTPQDGSTKPISIPSPHAPNTSLSIPFASFSEPIETTLFAPSFTRHDHDDHDQPLPSLIFSTLIHLPPDIRSICMARLLFTGGGSQTPGLKPRLVAELSVMVNARGFDPVFGEVPDARRQKLKEICLNSQVQNSPVPPQQPGKKQKPSPSLQPQTIDKIDRNLATEKSKTEPPPLEGVVRGIETLGSWAGASLMSSLRIKGVVDIDRESFLQYGLAGARKEGEPIAPQGAGMAGAANRRSYAGDLGRLGEGTGKGGWTLGAWA